MAITVTVRPSLIVSGIVVATNPRLAFDPQTRQRTDEVIGFQATISQENGAQVNVRYGHDDSMPNVLSKVAVIVDVSESREYGAGLVYQRDVTSDDLDKIHSNIAANLVAAK